MQISIENIGKKYNNNWIFQDVSYVVKPQEKLALLGSNGSGKSTLLQIISGHIVPTVGAITFSQNNENLDVEKVFQHIAFCSPALELIEEFSIQEFLEHHFYYKKSNYSVQKILEYIGLQERANTLLANASSGMKQRVKLAQAFFCNASVLLLDEPCTNLDENGLELYHKMVQELTTDKTIIIGSNDPKEYSFCQQHLSIIQFKN